MATKYVENYRNNGATIYSDTDTIHRAVGNMTDGDTLVFEAGRTYVINHPINLIECVDVVDGEKSYYCVTKRHLTVDGNGCTICGSNSFIENYGKVGRNNKNALFYTSDNVKHGMEYCTVKNFHFTWKAPGSSKSYDESIRNMGLGVVTTDSSISDPIKKSVYFSNSIIENCTFEGFRVGLYQCGEDSIVRRCTFTNCYEGILSDGSVHNVFENNYFFTTFYIGLHLSWSPDSTVRNNRFYKCKKFSIYANGKFEKVFFDKTSDEYAAYIDSYKSNYPVRITIADNKIFGRYCDVVTDKEGNLVDEYVQDIGIRLHAVQNAIVTGNHIAGIGCDRRLKENEPSVRQGYGFGIGINVEGSVDLYAGVCFNKNVIISNNCIYDCFGGGIKINNAVCVEVSNNNIINNSNYGIEEEKIGIEIKNNTKGVSLLNNTLYGFNFSENIKIPEDYRYVESESNSIIKFTFDINDYLTNTRIIDNATYSSPYIILPDSISNLSNNEKFRLKIPENYIESMVLYIRYNNVDYVLYENNPFESGGVYAATNLSSSKAGKCVWMRYLLIDNVPHFFYMKDAD